MKACIYRNFGGKLELVDLPDPHPGTDGVVIEVRANGICRSDWHGWMGHDADVSLPHVPGHELAGVIVETGSGVTRFRAGDRVTLPFCMGCGSCPTCLDGNTHICDDYAQPGFTHWGSFAEYVALPYADNNLAHLPDSLDYLTAASLGCRFITAYRAVVHQGRIREGEWLVIHGCGGIGLSALMIARAMGLNTIAVDLNNESLSFAAQLGATSTLNPNETDSLIDAVHEISHGGAHVSLDAFGSNTTCLNSIQSLRKRGRHIQVGLMVEESAFTPLAMNTVMARELELIGSHGMPARDYPDMIAQIEQGRLNPEQLIGQTVTLEESMAVLENLDKPGTGGIAVIDFAKT